MNTGSFLVGNGASAHFIFANLHGTTFAWDTGTTAFIQVPAAGALYTGLAINATQTRPYAANGAGSGSIDAFDSSFAPVSLGATAFANPFPGLVPFNVRDIGGKVYVTYAPPGRPNQTGAALGAVAVFDENGSLLDTLINGSQLAAPWGVALAPARFGPFGGDLLVGNFSFLHSEINAFDPVSGAFGGTIPVDVGDDSPGGLWDLIFGNGGNGGDPNTLYLIDGINGETNGLLTAVAVAEPSDPFLLATALDIFGTVARYSGKRNRVV